LARSRNRSAERRAEYALTANGRRMVINEILFLTLCAAGIVEQSRRRNNHGKLRDGWSFQREAIENEHNRLSASKDEWVLRRVGADGEQEIVTSDPALISFLGVLIRRRARM
jgi:hypothetical protein